MAADRAGVGGVTALGASGFGDHAGVAVVQRLGLAIHIAVAADRAGMGGITALGASRLGDHAGVAVTVCGNSGGIGITTVGASVLHIAIFGAGCILGIGDLVIVAGCIHLVIHIGIATLGAGVGGVATLGAVTNGNDALVIMTGCRNNRNGFLVTDGALMGHAAIFRASCILAIDHFVLMTQCRQDFAVGDAVRLAGVLDIAILGAGCILGVNLVILAGMLLVQHQTTEVIGGVAQQLTHRANQGNGIGVTIEAVQIVCLTILGEQHIQRIGIYIIGHRHGGTISIAVDTLVLEGGQISQLAGFHIHLADVVHEVGIDKHVASVGYGQHGDTSLRRSATDRDQFGQKTRLQIHFVELAATGQLVIIRVGFDLTGADNGHGCMAQHTMATQSQQAVVHGIPCHITDRKGVFVLIVIGVVGVNGVAGVAFLYLDAAMADIVALEIGICGSHEEVTLFIITIEHTIHHCHGANSRIGALFCQIDGDAGVRTQDRSKAAVGTVVGEEVIILTVNDDGAGRTVGLAAIRCSDGDGNRTGRNSGNLTILVHRCHRLVRRCPSQICSNAGRLQEGVQCHAVSLCQFTTGRHNGQALQGGGDLGIVLAEGHERGDLCAGTADGAQIVTFLFIQIQQIQATDIARLCLVQTSPVDIASVIVVGHGGQHIAGHTSVHKQFHGALFGIQDIHLCSGCFRTGQFVTTGASFNCVDGAIGIDGQAHKHRIGEHAGDQLTGLQIHIVQIRSRIAGAAQCIHRAGGIVEGHVIDEAEAVAHIGGADHRPGLGIDHHVVEVCVPVIVIVTVGIDIAIHILCGIEQPIGAIVVNILNALVMVGIRILHVDPVVAIHAANIGQQEAIEVARGLLNSDGEGSTRRCSSNLYRYLSGTFADSHQFAIYHLNNIRCIRRDGVAILFGCIHRENSDSGSDFLTDQHDHIIALQASCLNCTQFGDLVLVGNNVQTDKLNITGVGGLAQGHRIGSRILYIDPVDGAVFNACPQQNIVDMVVAHALRIVQHIRGSLHDQFAVELVLFQRQAVQLTIIVDTVESAIHVACPGNEDIANNGHLHQLTTAGADGIQRSRPTDVVMDDGIHNAGGVVIGHIRRHSAAAIAQRQAFASCGIKGVALAEFIVAVDQTLVTIVISSDEVNSGFRSAFNGHASQIDVQPAAPCAIVGVIVVCIQRAAHIHNNNVAGDGQTSAGCNDIGFALRNRSDRTVLVNSCHIFIGGSPNDLHSGCIPG